MNNYIDIKYKNYKVNLIKMNEKFRGIKNNPLYEKIYKYEKFN